MQYSEGEIPSSVLRNCIITFSIPLYTLRCIRIGFAIIYVKKSTIKRICVINQFFNCTIKQDKVYLQ